MPNKYDCRGLTAAVLIALPLVFAVGSLALGAYAISPLDVCRIIAERATGHDFGVSAMAANLVWEVRMPRVLAAAMVGAGLAASGTLFQGLFRNPLAAPDTLGVSNGAGFGAALAIVAGLAGFGAQMGAIAFGLAAVALAFAIVNASDLHHIAIESVGRFRGGNKKLPFGSLHKTVSSARHLQNALRQNARGAAGRAFSCT